MHLYHTLRQDKEASTSFALEPVPDYEFRWDDKVFAVIKGALDKMDYDQALRGLAVLLPLKENKGKKEPEIL